MYNYWARLSFAESTFLKLGDTFTLSSYCRDWMAALEDRIREVRGCHWFEVNVLHKYLQYSLFAVYFHFFSRALDFWVSFFFF